MKKLVSLLLAVMLVFAASVSVLADFEQFDEEPSSYIWLKADGTTVPNLTFKVPATVFNNGVVTISARVCFGEDITGEGHAYVNAYSYDDEEQYNQFAHLIIFKDFAASNEDVVVKDENDEESTISPLGKWIDYEFTFDPFNAEYAAGNKNTVVVINDGKATPEMITLGIGFYQATGTVSVANMSVRQNNEVVWSVDFSAGFDLEDEEMMAKVVAIDNITADNEDVNWGVVVPDEELIGGTNIAEDCTCTIVGGNNEGDPKTVGGNDTYCTSLTDGVASPDKEYSSKWFGFLSNNGGARDNAVTEGATKIGKAVIDLGEKQQFSKVRTHVWAAGTSGIGVYDKIIVHVSDDNENWTEVGEMLLGPEGEVYWAETSDNMEPQEARYVMVEYQYLNGVWGFVNEIQVIQDTVVDVSNDESEPASTEPASEPAEESSQGGSTPTTGDAGIIALAVVSVIALGGAVIVKKSK